MSDIDEDEVIDESLTNIDVINKYTASATIANKALAKIVTEIKAGVTILSLCDSGDKFIEEEVKKVLKSQKNIDKGLAFPTCISRNNVVGHFSAELEDKEALEEGDVVKIDLGVHVDGFIAVAAHTHIVGAGAFPTTGRKADAICAAHVAGQAILRLLKPGAKNKDITAVIKQVAEAYKVNAVEGVLSHVMRRYLIDGEKVIMNKSTPEQQAEEFEVEENDVYAIDIVISTGEGKPKERERRPTVYKRVVDQSYMLKLQAARKVFTEIKNKYPALPFSLRNLEEKHVRFGMSELEKHGLVTAFPVLYEKNGEFVVQYKFTVLVGSGGSKRITEHPLPYVQSEHSVEDPALKELLASNPSPFNKAVAKKKKNKKPKADTGASASTTTTATTTAAAPAPAAEPMDTN